MQLFLGCPMWRHKAWVGSFLSRDARPADYLRQYAHCLSSVEGNTTFYALPKPEVVQAWRRAVPPGFRFTFKFPRTISHDLGLRECEAETSRFLNTLAPLGTKLGQLFLQLPPNFADLGRLEAYLAGLPRDFHYAVEVRHPRFFDGGPFERAFTDLLQHHGADQVVFDTHRLMTMETNDPGIRDAMRRKPKMPPRARALGPRPFLRFVGRPRIEEDTEVLDAWARTIAHWLHEGRTPYVFMHQVPEDDRAPQLCRIFHDLVRVHAPELPPLPPFPCEGDTPIPEQLSLF